MDLSLAIIILNYNDFKETEKNVDKLISLGIKYPVVIVDNNSINESFSYLVNRYKDDDNIFIIKNETNSGYASGNNYGIKYVLEKYKTIKYVCIMNPDVIVSYKNIFKNMINKIENRRDVALITSMMILNEKLEVRKLCWKIPTPSSLVLGHSILATKLLGYNSVQDIIIDSQDDSLGYADVMPGCFFIIKSEILKEIDYFDENTFLYNEENILAIKLKQKGYKEAISINDYYFHNHKLKNYKKSLKSKINQHNIAFNSKKYLCKTYYSKRLVITLYILQYINIAMLSVGHFIKLILTGLIKRK